MGHFERDATPARTPRLAVPVSSASLEAHDMLQHNGFSAWIEVKDGQEWSKLDTHKPTLEGNKMSGYICSKEGQQFRMMYMDARPKSGLASILHDAGGTFYADGIHIQSVVSYGPRAGRHIKVEGKPTSDTLEMPLLFAKVRAIVK